MSQSICLRMMAINTAPGMQTKTITHRLSSALNAKMNMDIRKEIETLASWYIPAVIITGIATSIYTGYFKEVFSSNATNMGSTLSFLSATLTLIRLPDDIVVAVWLYSSVGKEGGRSTLWFIFGLVANLFAAIIYIVLRMYEQQAFNNRLKRELGDDSRPEAP